MSGQGISIRQPLRPVENIGMISIPKLKTQKKPTFAQDAVVPKLEELRSIITTHVTDLEVADRAHKILGDITKLLGVEIVTNTKCTTAPSPLVSVQTSVQSMNNHASPTVSSVVKFSIGENVTDRKAKTPKSTGKFTTSKIASAVAEVERSASVHEDAIEESIYGHGVSNIPESPFCNDTSRLSVGGGALMHWDNTGFNDNSSSSVKKSAAVSTGKKKVKILRSLISPSLTADDDVDSDAETVYAKTPANANRSRGVDQSIGLIDTPMSATQHLCQLEVDTPIANASIVQEEDLPIPGVDDVFTATDMLPPAENSSVKSSGADRDVVATAFESVGDVAPQSAVHDELEDVGGLLHWNVDGNTTESTEGHYEQKCATSSFDAGNEPTEDAADCLGVVHGDVNVDGICGPASTHESVGVLLGVDPSDDIDPLNLVLDNGDDETSTAGFGRRKASSRRASIKCRENMGVILGKKKATEVATSNADVVGKKVASRRGKKKVDAEEAVEALQESSSSGIAIADNARDSGRNFLGTGAATAEEMINSASSSSVGSIPDEVAAPVAVDNNVEEEEEEEPIKIVPKKRAYNRRGSIRSRVQIEDLLRQEEEEEKEAAEEKTQAAATEVEKKGTRGRSKKKEAADLHVVSTESEPPCMETETETKAPSSVDDAMLPWDGGFDGDVEGGTGMLHWNNDDAIVGGMDTDTYCDSQPMGFHHAPVGCDVDEMACAIDEEVPKTTTPAASSKGKKRGFNRRASIRSRVQVEEILRRQGLGDDDDGDDDNTNEDDHGEDRGSALPRIEKVPFSLHTEPSSCSIDVLEWPDQDDMGAGTLHWNDGVSADEECVGFPSESARLEVETTRVVRTSPTKKRLVQQQQQPPQSEKGSALALTATRQAPTDLPIEEDTEQEKSALRAILAEGLQGGSLRNSLQMLTKSSMEFVGLAATVKGFGASLFATSKAAAAAAPAAAAATSGGVSDASLISTISRILPLLHVTPEESQEGSVEDFNKLDAKAGSTAAGNGGKSKATTAKKSALKKAAAPEPPAADNDRNKAAKGSKKGIRFCMVDGSSVYPPNDREENSWMPALHSSRRLHKLIALVDEMIGDHDDNAGVDVDGNNTLRAIARGAKALSNATAASDASKALQDHLSIQCNAEEILVSAKIVRHEFELAASTPRLQIRRRPCTALRFRAAWVATAVLRAQLRWLFDCPPPSISVPAVAGEIAYSGCRSKLHTLISLRARPVVVPSYLSPSKSSKKRKKSDAANMVDHTIVIPSEMPISTLVTLAMKQIFHALSVLNGEQQDGHGHVTDDYDAMERTTEVLSAAVLTSSGKSAKKATCLSLDELAKRQPQIALAAERGRFFLLSLMTHPIVANCNTRETSLWTIMTECAEMVGLRGMSEDKHLCLFRGGWRGIQQFAGTRLLSAAAEKECQGFVDALIHDPDLELDDKEEALLLHSSLIYEFPEIVEVPKS